MSGLNIFRGTGPTHPVDFLARSVTAKQVGPDSNRRDAHAPHNISGSDVPHVCSSQKRIFYPHYLYELGNSTTVNTIQKLTVGHDGQCVLHEDVTKRGWYTPLVLVLVATLVYIYFHLITSQENSLM